jgi:hypothetical protein
MCIFSFDFSVFLPCQHQIIRHLSAPKPANFVISQQHEVSPTFFMSFDYETQLMQLHSASSHWLLPSQNGPPETESLLHSSSTAIPSLVPSQNIPSAARAPLERSASNGAHASLPSQSPVTLANLAPFHSAPVLRQRLNWTVPPPASRLYRQHPNRKSLHLAAHRAVRPPVETRPASGSSWLVYQERVRRNWPPQSTQPLQLLRIGTLCS